MLNIIADLLEIFPQDIPKVTETVPSPEAEAFATLGNTAMEYLPHALAGITAIWIWRKFVTPITNGVVGFGRGLKSMAPMSVAALIGTAGPPAIETLHQKLQLAGNGTVAAWIGTGIILIYCITTQFRIWNKVPEKPALKAIQDKLDNAIAACTVDSNAYVYCTRARKDLHRYV